MTGAGAGAALSILLSRGRARARASLALTIMILAAVTVGRYSEPELLAAGMQPGCAGSLRCLLRPKRIAGPNAGPPGTTGGRGPGGDGGIQPGLLPSR